jgi:hypothetical protein
LHTVTSKAAFSVSVDGRHIVRQARGLIFLTSQRVRAGARVRVFASVLVVCSHQSHSFKSFFLTLQVILCSEVPSTDRNFFFPIVMITNAHYEQPVFSANNFRADCDVLPDGKRSHALCASPHASFPSLNM